MSPSPDCFDPYHEWLGISPADQPPDHYRLLGLSSLEPDPKLIGIAADRQMVYVKGFQHGPHAAASQRILNELAVASSCLLNPASKAAYDQTIIFGSAQPPESTVLHEPVTTVIRPSKTKRKRASTSPIMEGVKVVLGGAAGIFLAVLLLSYFWDIDILGMRKPVARQTSKANSESTSKVKVADVPKMTDAPKMADVPKSVEAPRNKREAPQDVPREPSLDTSPIFTASEPDITLTEPALSAPKPPDSATQTSDQFTPGSIWEGLAIQTKGPGSGDETKVIVTVTSRTGDSFSGTFHWTNLRSQASGERKISGRIAGQGIEWEGTVGKLDGAVLTADWQDGQYAGTERLTRK